MRVPIISEVTRATAIAGELRSALQLLISLRELEGRRRPIDHQVWVSVLKNAERHVLRALAECDAVGLGRQRPPAL